METKRIRVLIVSILSLLLVSAVFVISYRFSPSFIGEDNSSQTEVKDPSQDLSTDSSGGSPGESDSEAVATDLSLKDLSFCYVASEYGDYRLGLVTEQLEANTQYCIRWKIDPSIRVETVCFFAQRAFDDVIEPYVVLNTSYVAGEELGRMYSHSLESELFENQIIFTTENIGDSVVFFPLAFNAANGEQAKAIVTSAKPFFTEVTISKMGVE